MGIPCSGREQGCDGCGPLRDDAKDWDDTAFLYHCSHEYAGIFTLEYELALAKRGDSVLFDRQADPDQIRNLFADPACCEIVDSLTRRVVQHNVDMGSPAAEWLKNREGVPIG